MKLISKIIIAFLLFIILVAGFLYTANLGYLNLPVKYAFQCYLKVHGMNSQITGFKYRDSILYSDTILIKYFDATIKVEKFKSVINFHFDKFVPKIDLAISANNIILADKDDFKIMDTNLSANYQTTLFNNTQISFNFSNIKIDAVQNIDGKAIQDGTAQFEYLAVNGKGEYKLRLELGENSSLSINSTEGKISNLTAEVENMPLMLYHVVHKIAPENQILVFLKNFVKSGFITKGNLVFNYEGPITNKIVLTEANTQGNFKLQKLNLKYSKDLPQIKNMDVDAIITGKEINFHVNEAYSSKIKIYDGNVGIDWQGVDNTEIIILAKGKGPVSDLTDFLPEKSHANLREANINLREFTGITDAIIKVNIPLKAGLINKYDISAEIPHTGISIFKNQIQLTKTSLLGKYDGKLVTIGGKGKINGYNTDLSFIYRINKGSQDAYQLDLRTYFTTNPNKTKHQKIGFISFLKGDSFIDLSYKNIENKGTLKIVSDLKNLDLYFDKLGIHKEQGQTGEFLLNGEFTDANTGKIEFGVHGQNNLHISGNMKIKDKVTEIIFPQVKHNQTDLTASVKIKGDLFEGNINGKILDLSNADMLQFLGKERDNGRTKIKMKIDQVILKSNIWLTDLKLKFDCDQDKCNKGYIDSNIGTKSLELLLRAKDSWEEWILTCSNAGALLKGIGAYESMRAGNLTVTLNTSRKEVSPGEIIPILNGNFDFERFVLHDAPTLSRLVSFVSLPGFVNAITNNKDIVFSRMIGNFSFSNRALVISKGIAKGPFFDFTIGGNIDTFQHKMQLQGHVTPALYGISKIIGSIPIMGTVMTGDKKHRGLISAPFKIDQKY